MTEDRRGGDGSRRSARGVCVLRRRVATRAGGGSRLAGETKLAGAPRVSVRVLVVERRFTQSKPTGLRRTYVR
jgi:hypothetical protein